MGPYIGSSSNLPPVPQWPATTPGFQPHSASFLTGQTQQVIIPGTPSLFPSNYPVAGPGTRVGSVLPGSITPGYGFSPGASAFPAANFPSFVVGPGIPPVAPKIVAAIVSGEFIELASLLEDRIEPEPPSFTLIADQLVIRPTKRRKAITDILSWMQAFAVYTLVATAYYPARVADLLKYQLLIMRTAQQFSGSAWLSYDRAFRRQASAYKLTDWSQLNPELFHFYVSGYVSVKHSTVAPLSSQSLRPSRLAPLTSWRRRVLRRRPRFATPGTPVVARPSFYAVVFATRVTFLDVPLCIVVWWRIARPLIHQLLNRLSNGVGLRTHSA